MGRRNFNSSTSACGGRIKWGGRMWLLRPFDVQSLVQPLCPRRDEREGPSWEFFSRPPAMVQVYIR